MKHVNLRSCILFFSLIGIGNLFAQRNLPVSGGEAAGSGGTVSYSIGQVDYIEQTGNGTSNQGLQQPYEFYIVGIDNHPEILLEMLLFPNPTSTNVTLKISELNSQDMFLTVVDLKGVILIHERIRDFETQVFLDHSPSGAYLLNVSDQNDILKTFRIIKN